MNILIVDDSVALRKILERMIRTVGVDVHEIREAGDGQGALESLESFWADVILSDIRMPNMDGLRLLSHIRAIDTWKDTKVIMMSTECTRDKVMEAIQSGANGFIRKPFSKSEIQEKLGRARLS